VYLKFICIFTPYLSRPEHAGPWYLIYVLQIVPDYISFLKFDDKNLLTTQNQEMPFHTGSKKWLSWLVHTN